MNAIEYAQTLAAAEMLQDQKHISKTMNVERSKIVHRSKNPDDWEVVDYSEEVLIDGTVEYNCELDGYQIVGLYATGFDGDQIDLTDSERQRATYLLINEYFDQVWG